MQFNKGTCRPETGSAPIIISLSLTWLFCNNAMVSRVRVRPQGKQEAKSPTLVHGGRGKRERERERDGGREDLLRKRKEEKKGGPLALLTEDFSLSLSRAGL